MKTVARLGGYELQISRKGRRVLRFGLTAGLVGLLYTMLLVLAVAPEVAPDAGAGARGRALLSAPASGTRAYQEKYGDGGFDPDNDDPSQYYLYSIAGFVIGGVALLFGVLYCCSRLCCPGKCGGKPADGGPYPPKQILALRILLGLLCIVIVSGSVQGYVANSKISEGVDGFLDALTDTLDAFVADVNRLADDLNLLENDPGVAAEMEQFRQEANQFQGDVNEIEDEVRYYDGYRLLALNFAFALPLVSVLLGAIAAILKKGYASLIMAMSGFLVMSLAWITFAIHDPLARLIDDMCIEYDKVLVDGFDPEVDDGSLLSFVKCPDEFLAEPSRIAAEGINEAIDELEVAVEAATTQPVDPPLTRVEGTVGTPEFSESLLALEADLERVPSGQDDIDTIVEDVQTYTRVLATLSDMANCDIIDNFVRDSNEAVCKDLIDGLYLTQQSAMQIGICLFFVIVIGILGIKRLENPDGKDQPLQMDAF